MQANIKAWSGNTQHHPGPGNGMSMLEGKWAHTQMKEDICNVRLTT
jgi:hypothetical protein